ncbi:MAG: dockerin type I domain-containing protein [Chthoniobacterales bacterium]
MPRRGVDLADGTTTANIDIPARLLAGDVNSSGGVTSSDVAQTKSATSPGTVNASNFRTDVNADGSINATDVGLVKSKSGNAVP